MRGGLLFLVFAAALGAQPKSKQAPPPNPLAELEAMGAVIARAVEFKDWAKVLSYEPPEWRAEHAKELADAKSDFYCFLVDAACNANGKGRTSIFHLLSRAHSLGVTAVGNPEAATLYFYDRSVIPTSSLRSEKFLCQEGGWAKVAFWYFHRENGKWVAETPAFNYATDAC